MGQDARPGNRYVYRLVQNGSNLIALSDFLANQFERNYNIRPKHIIPGAIAADTFAHYDGPRDIDLLGAGSLIPLKQYEVFINVVNEIKQQFAGIKAIICGKGPEMLRLQQQISQLGLQDNVKLMDEIPHPAVLALMQRSRVFMHPSNYEGFSTVCIEAIYAGAHVVSFIQPMKHDIAQWRVAKNKDEMAQIICGLLADKSLKHQSVLPYRVEDTAKQLIQLYANN